MSGETVPARRIPRTRRAAGRIRDVGSPVYDSLFREPIRRGRLRLDVTSPLERQLAIVGLVVLFGSLGSLVLGNLWRQGTLLSLSDTEGRWLFVPQALFAGRTGSKPASSSVSHVCSRTRTSTGS